MRIVSMNQDYKRTICVMCPAEADCRRIRENTHCETCESALVCGAEGELGQHDCNHVKHLWRELPRKCLLACSILRTRKIPLEEAFQFIATMSEVNEGSVTYRCPRCGAGGLHIERQRNFMPLFERKDSALVTKYRLVCHVCGIDEQVNEG